MFKAIKNFVVSAVGVVTGLFVSTQVFAQSTGISATLDAVDLSGIATKVGALALLVVGVALVFKGPALAKRIIRNV